MMYCVRVFADLPNSNGKKLKNIDNQNISVVFVLNWKLNIGLCACQVFYY